MSATVISESLDSIRVFLEDVDDIQGFTLSRLHNDTVQILLHACCAWMIEHSSGKLSVLLRNKWWQHSIIPNVIVRVVFVIRNPDTCKPFDASSTNISWNEKSDRKAMVSW
jgi:hypothetical protein